LEDGVSCKKVLQVLITNLLRVAFAVAILIPASVLHAQDAQPNPNPTATAEPAAESTASEAPKNEVAKVEPPKADKRLFGVLPNYRTVDGSIPFSPLSNRQKLSIATHDSFDWPTYVASGFWMLLAPGRNTYGSGLSGFVGQYSRSAADQITGNMLSEGFMPVVFRQDPRYFRVGSGSFSSRLFSAVSQIAVAKNDQGRPVFNISEFLGNAIAVGISNAYSPSLNTWPHRSEKLGLMISSDTLSNVVKEFGPDIRQRLPHRHKNS
jgi:hypothetical protein